MRKLRLFARSPKGLMLWILVLLAAIALPTAGIALALPKLLIAVAAAMAVDLTASGMEPDRPGSFSSGVLTGLFVGLILSPVEPWYTVAIGAVVANGSKHVIRVQRWGVFNPAALGLLVVALVFGSAESWWGSLPDLPVLLLPILLVTGIFIAGRVNKLPLVLSFLAAYYLLFTAASYADNPAGVAEAFRPPYVNVALFFAFFMLTDPPTTPSRYPEQVTYGILVALMSFVIQQTIHPQYFLLAGLLIGNAGFAWWRTRTVRRVMPATP